MFFIKAFENIIIKDYIVFNMNSTNIIYSVSFYCLYSKWDVFCVSEIVWGVCG